MRRSLRKGAARLKKLNSDSAAGQAESGKDVEAPTVHSNVDSNIDDQLLGSAQLPDPKPKWRAMFNISVNNRRKAVLADSGCTGTCMSYEHYLNNPSLKNSFVPNESCGTAINGTRVPSIGEVRLKFSLDGTPMDINCKVIKGLMDSVVLGWDWMSKYEVVIDAANGELRYIKNKCAKLLKNSIPLASCFYRVFEDLILPPFSKVQTDVELMINNEALDQISPTVVTEPFSNNGANYWAARTCSNVIHGMQGQTLGGKKTSSPVTRLNVL